MDKFVIKKPRSTESSNTPNVATNFEMDISSKIPRIMFSPDDISSKKPCIMRDDWMNDCIVVYIE